MTKNKLKKTALAAVMVCTLCIAAYLGMPKEQDYELLLANVEALAKNENDENSMCGTKSKRIDERLKLCTKGCLVGFKGTEYQYSSVGIDTKYKTGRDGEDFRCNSLRCGIVVLIDTTKEYECKDR